MNTVTFTIKPPTLQNILEVVLNNELMTLDWYNKLVHSYQPGIIRIKELFCFVAYNYGYTRAKIGPFIGSDTGNSVPYYYDKMKTCIKVYEEDSKKINNIVESLIGYERYTIEAEFNDMTDSLKSNLSTYASINRFFSPKADKVYLKDIKWKDKPLRDIKVYSSTEYQIVKLSTNSYQIISAHKEAGKAM